MAKLSSQKIVRETNHRWCSPLCSKRECDEALCLGWVGEPFLFLSTHCLSSFYLNLFGIPTTWHPWNCTHTPRSRPKILWFFTDVGDRRINKLSLHPHGDKICVLFSSRQMGHFGNRNGSWVLGLIGLMKEASHVWSGFTKGFYTGVLGRTV